MTYYPHTEADRQKLIRAIGVKGIEDVFADVPASMRFPALDLPAGLSPMEIEQSMIALAARNLHPGNGLVSFLGAGAYRHYRPPFIDYLISRGEFLTAYTPYQPEVSQGTLQAIFEYQTMMAELTGMDVSNAGHYDGATAMAEAVIMAVHMLPGRKRVLISPSVHPHYRQVVRTYTQGMGLEIVTGHDPLADFDDLFQNLNPDTALVIVQSPNFFGQMEPIDGLVERIHRAGALLCVVAEPIHMDCSSHLGHMARILCAAKGNRWVCP